MTTIDFTNLETNFSQINGRFNFNNFVSAAPTFYTWTTTSGHTMIARGEGITESNGVPTGGTITSVEIILDGTDPTNVDVTITDIDNIALTSLALPNELSSGDKFWAAIQEGPVTITETGNTRSIVFNFAGPTHEGGVLKVADNSAEGFFPFNSFLSGGVYSAEGGLLTGGDFDFTGRAAALFGDARFASGDVVVVGGDDHFIYGSIATAFRTAYFGDVETASGSAHIIGGDDILDMRSTRSEDARIYGDLRAALSDDVVLSGGDDIIYGPGSGTGVEIYGDAEDVAGATVQGGDDTIYGGAADEQIYGDWRTPFNEIPDLQVGGNDTIFTGGGDNDVYGGGGNDRITGGDGNNELYGGAGRDKFFMGTGAEFGIGGNGDDLFLMGLGETGINGGGGSDRATYYRQDTDIQITWASGIATAQSADFLGDHTLVSIDTFSGSNTGSDRVVTDDSTLTINTNGGNDVYIAGDQSSDTVNLGAGDDIARGGVSRNTIDGGDGRDTLTYSTSDAGVYVDLGQNFASDGNASGDIIMNFERVNGSNGGADRLVGSSSGNILKGLGGTDELFGGGGTDKLYGGSQGDTLNGGTGTDYLFGGSGRDTFEFVQGNDRDIIRDFQNNADRIELDGFAADTNWRDFATQDGSDVVLNFGGGDRLIIEDILIGQLGNDIFLV